VADEITDEIIDLVEASDFVRSRACNDAKTGRPCWHPACHEELRIADRLPDIAFKDA
jgi:hypothetical protein